MMHIIGHRGAAGLAPENTLKSIKLARKFSVQAIEFDIRITKDNKLVVCHDKDLERIANKKSLISKLTLVEILAVKTISGEPIPTLAQAIKEAGDTALLIEGKDSRWAESLAKTLKSTAFSNPPKVLSFNHKELLKFKKLSPQTFLVASEQHNPFKTIYFAKENNIPAVCMKFWIYHPIMYWLAQKNNLEMYAYTINNRLVARIFHLLYPKVMIITNYPNKFN